MIAVADSSAIISLFVETDKNYSLALAEKNALITKTGNVYVPTEVFSETINIIGKKFGHKKAMEVAREIFEVKSFSLIDTTEQGIRMNALVKFQQAPSSVSYTDCLVMAFADHFETKIIFGFDEVFSKNGYVLPGAK